MFLTYIWQPRRLPFDQAKIRFLQILKQQQAMLADGWGMQPDLATHAQDRLLIGQLRYDSGVTGWQPWDVRQTGGLVWGGVCEQWLGHISSAQFDQILRTVEESPRDVSQWSGRYGLVAWNNRRETATLTTAPMESPSMWYTQGRDGWAAGSRAGPLLDMVDRGHHTDLDSVRLFLAQGWLYGDGALYKDVKRIQCRQQIVFGGSDGPKFRPYASLLESLDLESVEPRLSTELVQHAADIVVSRVRKQLAHSENPLLLLSGGRDSRCIAAAAKTVDDNLNFLTSGAVGSTEVSAANVVARRLQLKHKTSKDRRVTNVPVKSRLDAWLNHPDRLGLWMKLSEGLESLRHSLPLQGFFQNKRHGRPAHGPIFHGLGGELHRGTLYDRVGSQSVLVSRDIDTAGARLMRYDDLSNVPGMAYPRDIVRSLYRHLNLDIGHRLPVAKWVDIVYWQFKCARWGDDMLAAKSIASWRWTPLYDLDLLRLSFQLSVQEKGGSRFIEQIIRTIAPVLSGVPFDRKSPAPSFHEYLWRFMSGWAKTRGTRTRMGELFKLGEATPAEPALPKFWNQIFFTPGEHPWREFVTPQVLREGVDRRPSSEWLWRLATVELFIRSNC